MKAGRHTLAASISIACLALPASASLADARDANGCATYAQEAAARAALPLEMVTRVMRAESGGNALAVSPRGAIGCMQIVPATWATLTTRYGLGTDQFDARMNMIAGALYLAELRTRFGIPGAYAAYNAGPQRYIRFAANGVPLPAETVAYAARLGGAGAGIIKADVQARWQQAALFVARGSGMTKAGLAPPTSTADAGEAGGESGAPTSDSAPAARADPMFPLAVRNFALRR